MLSAEVAPPGRARHDRVQRLPVLRGVLSRVSGDGESHGVRERRPDVPREPLPQLRRVPVRLPVRAAARVRDQRAAHAGGDPPRLVRRVLLAGVHERRLQAQRRRRLDRALCCGDAGAVALSSKRPPTTRRLLPRRAARRDGRRLRRRRAVRGRRARGWRCPCVRRRRDGSVRRQPDARRCRGRASRRADAAPSARRGADCTSDVEERSPWRRWFHHCTFYGFALCFASTTVAAVYHVVFGWRAPYAYTSLPVVLGTPAASGCWSVRSACWRAATARPRARRSRTARPRRLVHRHAVPDER